MVNIKGSIQQSEVTRAECTIYSEKAKKGFELINLKSKKQRGENLTAEEENKLKEEEKRKADRINKWKDKNKPKGISM